MRTLLAFLAFFLTVGGTAAYAQPKLTDVQYVQAARCAGLVEGSGGDVAALNAILNTQSRSREAFIAERAANYRSEAARAIRKATGAKLAGLTTERDRTCATLVTTAQAGGQPVS
jgi:hypothetical protein